MSSNDENEKQNKLLGNDNNANAKNKKTSTNTKKALNKKKRMKTFYQKIWETLMIKCLKNTITVNILSFINEFHHATNEEDKKSS